jgi:hypothetical protein
LSLPASVVGFVWLSIVDHWRSAFYHSSHFFRKHAGRQIERSARRYFLFFPPTTPYISFSLLGIVVAMRLVFVSFVITRFSSVFEILILSCNAHHLHVFSEFHLPVRLLFWRDCLQICPVSSGIGSNPSAVHALRLPRGFLTVCCCLDVNIHTRLDVLILDVCRYLVDVAHGTLLS